MTERDELMAKVRKLHQPHWITPVYGGVRQTWLVCHGCDEGAHAEVPAGWPCRTADIVYSAEEIAAREPQVPECPHDHRTAGEGPPVRARAVFLRLSDGSIAAARNHCDHVQPMSVESSDPKDWER